MCVSHLCVEVCDHLSSSLVSLSVNGTLLFLLEDAFASGAVLQSELTEDFTEPSHADLTNAVRRVTQEQQKRVKPATHTTPFILNPLQSSLTSDKTLTHRPLTSHAFVFRLFYLNKKIKLIYFTF